MKKRQNLKKTYQILKSKTFIESLPVNLTMKQMELAYILRVYLSNKGDFTKTLSCLNISRKTLAKKIKEIKEIGINIITKKVVLVESEIVEIILKEEREKRK